jgi:class 3 adenylate cyclase/tetratricopeptide (TPR) repeat protein
LQTNHRDVVPSKGAYVSLDRRRELAGLGDVQARSQGAALFADISGFTRLTEELGRTLGPRRGSEELTALLNRVFGLITAAIDHQAGSIISFGGDSVTCWFPDDDGWRATTVGHRLIMIFRDLRKTEVGPARSLDIKVAVASGTARRMRVGRAAHSYMDVLAGGVNDSLIIESSMLQAGELAVSLAVAIALEGRAKVVTTVTDIGRARHLVEEITEFPLPPPSLELTDEVAADEWLHPLVRDHLQQGLGGLMGQLRDVVTMFVGFEGEEDSLGPDESFDGFVARAQEVVASFEGMVLQALVDEKGSHIYAVFGASIAHEDEATRAVVAAQGLVGYGANPSQVRVGIAGGTVYVGAYGGEERMTFGVIGPSVNLAARLMQEAPPGSIYVSEDIARQRSQQVEFDEIGRAQLKGIDDPVPVFCTRPTAGRAGEARPTRAIGRIIGRVEERALLAAGLAELQSGRGGTFIIEGPAGIGKTRLIADFVERAEMIATRVITTAGEEIEHATAFFAWRSVLRQLFGGNDASGEAKLLDFMAADPWRAARVGLLDTIISTPVEDTYLTAGMEPGLRMENTYQLLTAIVRDAPRSVPLVLVLDDGHWMDSSSWAMAERVGREISSPMVVIGSRPFSDASGNPPPDEYRRLLEDSTTTHVVLDELEPTDALELVEFSLGVTSLPGPVSELIVEQAGGHPYFAEEMGFALRDAGLLIVEDGESRLAPEVHDLGDIDFPQSVQEVITGRFDRLTVMEQTILRVASVIGREFDAETLAEVYPLAISREQVEDSLQALVPLDLIQPVPGSDGHYRFRHAITRDIAYGLLLYAQRHQLHASVARWIESWHADDPDVVLAPLAYHSRNSLSPESSPEEVDLALGYLGRAGRKSLRSFAHREAIGLLNDAITIAAGDARTGDLAGVKPGTPVPERVRARWEQDLAEAHLGMGRVDQSALHFERALELHGHPMGKGRVGVGVRLLGAAARQAAHRVTRFQGRELDPDRRDDLTEAATAYERLMKIYYYANDPGSLITAAVSGLNLAERAGTSPVLARIYANMSIVSGIVPLHKLARTYARRSREVADEVDQMPEHAWVRLATSVYGVGVGDWELVEPKLRESYDLYKQLSDWRQLAETLGTTGQMLTAQGRFAEAYSLGEELRELGAWRDDAQAEMWGWLYQGSSLLRQGDPSEAISRLRNGERLLHAGVGVANVGWLYGVMAEAYRRLDDTDRARAAAVSAGESLYSERPGVVFVLDGFTGAAEAHFGLWVRGPARSAAANKAAAERAVKKLIGYSKVFPIGRPAALRYAGRVKEHEGDVDAARSKWTQALQEAQTLKMTFEEGLSSLNLGRLDRDHDRLRHARELFERLGARHFVDASNQALGG